MKLGLTSEKLVLYLGRLEEEKGVDYLIRAFARLNPPNGVLLLVGDGSVRENLKALVLEHGIQEKTRFVGYIRPEKALAYYAIADIFRVTFRNNANGKGNVGISCQ
jgi:glycosyltransferase involved in cell wall biosynthesis